MATASQRSRRPPVDSGTRHGVKAPGGTFAGPVRTRSLPARMNVALPRVADREARQAGATLLQVYLSRLAKQSRRSCGGSRRPVCCRLLLSDRTQALQRVYVRTSLVGPVLAPHLCLHLSPPSSSAPICLIAVSGVYMKYSDQTPPVNS